MDISSFVKDMQRAVNERNTEQWVDSVNKMFNIPRIVEEIKSGKITKATCGACKSLLALAKFLILIGQDDQTIAGTATTICTLLGPFFEAKDPSVCQGLMQTVGVRRFFKS